MLHQNPTTTVMPSERGINALPDELLVQIIQLIHPGDLVNFASAQRRLHRVSSDRLVRHRERLKQYRHVRICSEETVDNIEEVKLYARPVDLLLEIDHDPFLAYYLRALTYDREDPEEGGGYNDITQSAVDQAFGFTRLIESLPLLTHDAELKSSCASGVSRGDIDATLMLLLALAKNVSLLRSYGRVDSKQWLESAQAQETDCFKKLWKVESYSDGLGPQEMAWTLLWTLLPAIQSLSAYEPEVEEHPLSSEPSAGSQVKRHLQVLTLINSLLSGEDMAEVVLGLEGLCHLNYHDGRYRGGGWLWGSSAFIEALETSASETLLSLTLDFPQPPDETVSTLRKFKNLQHFRGSFAILPHTLFVEDDGKQTVILALGLTFPASLADLYLATWDRWHASEIVPSHFAFTNITGCPKLKKILLSEGSVVAADSLQALSDQRIEVKNVPRLGPYWNHDNRAVLPLFVRDIGDILEV